MIDSNRYTVEQRERIAQKRLEVKYRPYREFRTAMLDLAEAVLGLARRCIVVFQGSSRR